MTITFVQVDAFTNEAFKGNPAAICVTQGPCDEQWMQSVALEMNLSETAFVHPVEEGFRLRWFTPTTEVELCGHATLASAYVLWQDGHLSRDSKAVFETRSGRLSATLDGDWIWLDFPVIPVVPEKPPRTLLEGIKDEPVFVGKTKLNYLVELPSEERVVNLVPDLAKLSRLEGHAVAVTARSSRYDFVSRYFAPSSGIPEDPVTGSAHCALGPYWQTRLARSELIAYQASARGGIVRVRVMGERVGLGGQAVTTARGEICV